TGTHSPQAGLSRCPEGTAAILIQRTHPRAESAVLALHAAVLDRAQCRRRSAYQTDPIQVSAGPYRSFVIGDECVDAVAIEFRILRQFAVHPTGNTCKRPDPERSVAGDEQRSDPRAGEMLIPWRVPGHTPHTIETQQAEFGTEPQIAI